jgi:MFS family permease
MSATLQPSTENQVVRVDSQPGNKRLVGIDAIGVGIASGAAPFLPVFLTRLGATAVQVGLLTSMPGVTGLLLAIFVGHVLQKQRNIVPWYSYSRLIAISAYALTGIAPFFVPENLLVPVVLIIWAIATVPQTVVSVCFSVVMNTVSGPEGRYELMSRRWAILGLTTTITVALAGQLLDQINFHLNYQLLFIGLSLGGLLSYYASSRIKLSESQPAIQAARISFKANLQEYYRLIRSSPRFISFTLKQFVYLFGVTLGTPLFPLYFVRQINASDAWIGLVYTAQTAILVVSYFFWSRQSRRKGSRPVLLITTLCMSLYPGLVALANSQTLVFIYVALAGLFQAGIDLVFFDELMRTIPPQYSPTFVSFAQSVQYIPAILAPLVGTYLSYHIGLSDALLFTAGIRFLGFLLFAITSIPKRQPGPRAGARPALKDMPG